MDGILDLMLQSELFTKTSKEAPKDEEALNAKLLIRAGFIQKVMAGVYSYLPLGFKVLKKIEDVVREEMSAIGDEVLMPSLHPKENWEKTGRWKDFGALFKVISKFDAEYALGPTHEEIVTPMAQKFAFSYRDFPFAVFQIQTKFRDEERPKSGLLRGREFRMKDLYSFHTDPNDLKEYYERAKKVYEKTFLRLGLSALLTEASGGTFSKFSHEYQVLSPNGEDTVYFCGCGFARNAEIAGDLAEGKPCPNCGEKLQKSKGIEVGNIFELNTKFTEPFGFTYKDKDGKSKPVYMGCYGLGTSRAMGAVAETGSDEKGLIWPESIAPFRVHLLEFGEGLAKNAYSALIEQGIEVLLDDRDVSAGEKLADADLIGIPWRMIISEKTAGKVEVKARKESDSKVLELEEAIKLINSK
jgi:prolyl-tRNA synthetase